MKKYGLLLILLIGNSLLQASSTTTGLTVITAGDSENASKGATDPRMLQMINVMDMNNHDPLTGQLLGPIQLKLGQQYTLQIDSAASIQYFGTSLKEISRSQDPVLSGTINVVLKAQSLGQTGIKVVQSGVYDVHYQCMVTE